MGAAVFGHDAGQHGENVVLGVSRDGRLECRHAPGELPGIDGSGRSRLDALDRGPAQVLAGRFEHLAQALSGSQAGEDDIDIDTRFEPREPDHAMREIDDPDRLAHVEHVGRGGLGRMHSRRRSHQHEADRLADGHEVPLDLGMGHRDGSPAPKLLGEQWYDGAR